MLAAANVSRLAAARLIRANAAVSLRVATPSALAVASRPLLLTRSLATAKSSGQTEDKAALRKEKARLKAAKDKELKLQRETKAKERKEKEKAKAQLKAAKAAKAKEVKLQKQAKLKEKKQKEKARAQLKAAKQKEAQRKQQEKIKAQKAKQLAKPKKQKLEKWELLDENGKKVPLPTVNRPARLSSMTAFVRDFREEYAKTENKAQGDFLRLATEKWNSFSDAEKQRYAETARRHNADYPQRLEAWRNSLSEQDVARIKAYESARRRSARASRDPQRPNVPMGAFLNFLAEVRPSKPADQSSTDFVKESANRWRAMGEADKSSYIEKARKERDVYHRAMKEYEQQRASA